MSKPPIEVADIFRSHGAAYLEKHGRTTSPKQLKAMENIMCCRTAALGGHVKKCNSCDHIEVHFNSCRDRNCPKCQGSVRAEWLEARRQDLLPNVEYYHLVFTLPEKVSSLALQNRRIVYAVLFRAAAETLLTIARDPKHLGAQIGFLAILHTWGSNLHHHAHLHCVVPGGGISPDGKRWIPCRKDFFLPVRVLSALFQKKFLHYLNKAFHAKIQDDKLSFHGQLKHLAKEDNWKSFLSSLYDGNWAVYAKPPFGSAERVLKYLARYTHRVAISNQRLVSLEDAKVTFRWKDYADGNKQKTMQLDAVEFIRRYLQHVLPSGFVRIRHYGFLSNRYRTEKLALCRRLVGGDEEPQTDEAATESQEALEAVDSQDTLDRCPACRKGQMAVIEDLMPDSRVLRRIIQILMPHDTS
jgi:hypothetical protein